MVNNLILKFILYFNFLSRKMPYCQIAKHNLQVSIAKIPISGKLSTVLQIVEVRMP
ncbi:hypothetical protein F542_12650 [Bibersteinia trehalosi USDA-ARS-USMARC-188]|uniref:Uncharacterized protein n=3 Tax=Bibersteinia trehalosi TaxID=47735 RepID=W0R628_BIBTR|nr:hypothetical protein WQG_9390 [Bibersteinia trehalosi USDA-ARS-USMARC-192]AHG81983.1 hypothetical protein F542_12650 [Bibersteinia trehalosi USDA-ARS-USMARC-188]AHG84286.1 hypothetical protein F543_14220 [Bibersteinia trehalosi USDA-ARS-USMARC-189]AHG86206.1 hypothetical protein F544_9770 [Bibersteinia trehalosi USDA-ARS-USMARC-190]